MAALLTLGTAAAHSEAPDPPEPGVDRIRVSADGAGPSHIFWLNGNRSADVIGIVDPLYAAIRFYRVRRGAGTIASRLHPAGVCALPIDFRPWRVHQLGDRVLIESMPDPGAAGHVATPATMRTRMLVVRRRLLANPAPFERAAQLIDGSRWNPATAPSCGVASAKTGKSGAGAPERTTRRGERLIQLRNARAALAPASALTVRSRGYRLFSARELEPMPGYRIVQASEALPGDDGLIRVRYRILAYSRGRGTLAHALVLNDTELRGKLGQKPVVALPSGELLVMGKLPGEATPFRILSCGNIAGPPAGPCAKDSPPPQLQGNAVMRATVSRRAVARPLDARTIFANVARMVAYPLSVDTRGMPEACRRAEGCPVGGDTANFVPIRGIRLTRGIFTRRGVPYAQASVPGDIDKLFAATSAQLGRALAGVTHGARGWPGNLKDGLTGDLGVDCSGLVQIAWGGRGGTRLDTAGLQALTSPLACSARLPGPEYLRPGDAIGLRIDAPVHVANHVVLFAAAMRLDGANDDWLVLESSSGCDGVCWSVYDPGYFNGWGLYRARARGDADCITRSSAQATPIPFDLARWTRLIAGR